MPDEHDHDDLEMAELGALFERTRPGDVVWEAPPEQLWDRIAAAIEEPPAGVEPLARRRRTWWTIGAAAAAVVVVAVAALVLRRDDDQVVAEVELEQLGDSGSGRAELLDRGGSYQVRLETTGLDPADGYLELWLLDPSATRLVSLGPLRDDGLYDLPSGVDPSEFPVVDVSVEPVDGDPTHSGQSVLRGQLVL